MVQLGDDKGPGPTLLQAHTDVIAFRGNAHQVRPLPLLLLHLLLPGHLYSRERAIFRLLPLSRGPMLVAQWHCSEEVHSL